MLIVVLQLSRLLDEDFEIQMYIYEIQNIYIISSGSIRLKLKPYSIHYILSLQLVLSFKYQKDLCKTTNVNICLNVRLLSFLNIRLLKI